MILTITMAVCMYVRHKRFLADVTKESSTNKLLPENISLLFGPTLMRPRVDNPMNALDEMKSSQLTIRFLINDIIDRDSMKDLEQELGGRLSQELANKYSKFRR